MAWTYILERRDGSYYVGSTTDLTARLHQHQVGEGAAYTRPRRRRPVRLLWSGEFATAPEDFAFREAGTGLEPRQASGACAGGVRGAA